MDARALRKLSITLAAASGAVLIVMTAISMATGATQELHEHYKPPADYAADLLARPGATRVVFAFDVAFLALYTAFFGALHAYLGALGRPLVRIAFGAMLVVALLDIVEDHHILSLLSVAESGRPIDDSSIVFQDTLSATKFSVSYLSLVLFGLAIPRTSVMAWVLSLFLSVGTLINGVLGYAAPPAWQASLDSGRWVGFLAGFALAAIWLRKAPDAPAPDATPA